MADLVVEYIVAVYIVTARIAMASIVMAHPAMADISYGIYGLWPTPRAGSAPAIAMSRIVRALPLAVAGAPQDPHPTAFVPDIVMAFQGHGLYSRARCDRGV